MANITFVSTAVPGSANQTTSSTITIPTVQVDDFLILACTNKGATAAPSVTDNDTGGNTWTKKTTATSNGTLWYKRATSATSAKTITASGFTTSCAVVLFVLRGVYRYGDPFDKYTLEENISGNETHAAIVPSRNGCYVGLTVHNISNDESVTGSTTTSPGNLTEGTEFLSTGGTDSSCSVRGLRQATAATTGNFTWTQTDGVTTSQVFALLPGADTDNKAWPFAEQNTRTKNKVSAAAVGMALVVAAPLEPPPVVVVPPTFASAQSNGFSIENRVVYDQTTTGLVPSAAGPATPSALGWQPFDQKLPRVSKKLSEPIATLRPIEAPAGPEDTIAVAFSQGYSIESRVIYDARTAPLVHVGGVAPVTLGFAPSDQAPRRKAWSPYQPMSFVLALPFVDLGFDVFDQTLPRRRKIISEPFAQALSTTGGTAPPAGPSDTMAAAYSEGFGIASRLVYDTIVEPVRPLVAVATPSAFGYQVSDQLRRAPRWKRYDAESQVFTVSVTRVGFQILDQNLPRKRKVQNEALAAQVRVPPAATPSPFGYQVFDQGLPRLKKKLSDAIETVRAAFAVATPSIYGYQTSDHARRAAPWRLQQPASFVLARTITEIGWQWFDQSLPRQKKKQNEALAAPVKEVAPPPPTGATPSIYGYQIYDQLFRVKPNKLNEALAAPIGVATGGFTPPIGWTAAFSEGFSISTRIVYDALAFVRRPDVAAVTPSTFGWADLSYPTIKIKPLDLRHWNDAAWTPGQVEGGVEPEEEEHLSGVPVRTEPLGYRMRARGVRHDIRAKYPPEFWALIDNTPRDEIERVIEEIEAAIAANEAGKAAAATAAVKAAQAKAHDLAYTSTLALSLQSYFAAVDMASRAARLEKAYSDAIQAQYDIAIQLARDEEDILNILLDDDDDEEIS